MKHLLILCSLLALCSCGNDLVGVVTSEPSVPLEELRAAPLEVELGGQVLFLEPYLWRNFEPGADDNRLIASIQVGARESPVLAGTLEVTRLWVLHEFVVWETGVLEQRPPTEDWPRLEVVARDGPNWTTGDRVDVVVRVERAGGVVALLRMRDVEIVRVT